jgi:ATP-dependent Clp protease adapter protein ClpS
MTDHGSAEDSTWSVSLLNDDDTPMDFVVEVIEKVFDIDLESARHLMLRVHNEGAAECGIYPYEVASFCRKNGEFARRRVSCADEIRLGSAQSSRFRHHFSRNFRCKSPPPGGVVDDDTMKGRAAYIHRCTFSGWVFDDVRRV